VAHIRRSALVPYSAEQMFDLVNDIEAYPRRFNWCTTARVLSRESDSLTAQLDLRFAGFTQRLATRNELQRPQRIRMALTEGPFQRFGGDWEFTALGKQGCKVSLALDFEFAGKLIESALRLGFQGLADSMVDDFCRAAELEYG
jgi:ribosome-associated toxin RatA of RatAB toxin-antitoxin module